MAVARLLMVLSRRIPICLILGVVTTVGVAWGLAWYRTPERWHSPGWRESHGVSHDATPRWNLIVIERAHAMHIQRRAGNVATDLTRLALPNWSRVHEPPPIGVTAVVSETAFGWPFMALHGEWDWSSKRGAGFICLDQGYMQAYGLPLRPIAQPFIINTLFYAAMWFGIFFGVAALRRFVRKKRGRCVKCGYDLRGEFEKGCPECGWNRSEPRP